MSTQPALDQQAITDYVVEELGKGRDRRDIIFALCQKLNWPWPQAENFVVTIEHVDSEQIARKQLPVLLIVGISILIVGIALLVYGSYYFLHGAWLNERVYAAVITGIGMICGGIWGIWKAFMTSVGRE